MKNKFILGISIFFIFFGVLVSCNKFKKEIEFKTTENGLQYYIHESSDTGMAVKEGDYLVLSLTYKHKRLDSLMFDSKEIPGTYRIKVSKPSIDNGRSIEDAFMLLKEGDSASFLLEAKPFYFQTMKSRPPFYVIDNDFLRFDVRVIAIQTYEEVEADFKRIAEKNKREELQLLDEYVKKNHPEVQPLPSGVYVITEQLGTGEKVVPNGFISIHYEAFLIDGKKFDSSIEREQVFSFDIGKQQVVPGLEEAVTHLNVGSKAKIIIPSYLAYGEAGYDKIIPPYSTLIFNIEVLACDVFSSKKKEK